MASAGKKVLFNEAGVSASVIADPTSLELHQIDLIGVLEVTNSAAANFDLVIEHSPDKVNWSTLATVPNLIGNGANKIDIAINAFPNVRANLTRNAGTGDVRASIYYDKRK